MGADDNPDGFVDMVIVPRTSDLGDGFTVRRALPSRRRRMVGPFVFFDEMGPTVLRDGRGLDVRPHPHIGLATVTYLFEGEVRHADSLGTVQLIRPGEVNWMTAGRGIVHSERTPTEARGRESRLFGIQTWVALPVAHEEDEPSFVHHGESELPALEGDGAVLRLVVGALHGARSPVATLSDTLFGDLSLAAGALFELPAEHEERAAYVAEGAISVDPQDDTFEAGQLIVFRPGQNLTLRAQGPARLVLIGGEAMEGPRHIYWNFVSSSRERIQQAKSDWREDRFAPVPGEPDRISLPGEEPPPPVRYP